ncbi:MAG: hypothetical protein U0794_19605 [Isosphaeraceae bacterium]
MNSLVLFLAAYAGQVEPSAPLPVAPAAVNRVVYDATAADPPLPMSTLPGPAPTMAPAAPVPPAFSMTGGAPVNFAAAVEERRPFESDHAFDGFVGPMTDPIQAKDARSLT